MCFLYPNYLVAVIKVYSALRDLKNTLLILVSDETITVGIVVSVKSIDITLLSKVLVSNQTNPQKYSCVLSNQRILLTLLVIGGDH